MRKSLTCDPLLLGVRFGALVGSACAPLLEDCSPRSQTKSVAEPNYVSDNRLKLGNSVSADTLVGRLVTHRQRPATARGIFTCMPGRAGRDHRSAVRPTDRPGAAQPPVPRSAAGLHYPAD